MDVVNGLTLLLVMTALAALPSASVALVVARSATLGVANGLAVAVGIVLGDFVFVGLALLGLSVLAETLGALFALLKFAGGAYLIWLGLGILRAGSSAAAPQPDPGRGSLAASMLSGLVLTLGDLKAILFYASLFPSLFDLTTFTTRDLLLVFAITALTVGGVKGGYALAAGRLVRRIRHGAVQRAGRTVAGAALMGAGAYLIARG